MTLIRSRLSNAAKTKRSKPWRSCDRGIAAPTCRASPAWTPSFASPVRIDQGRTIDEAAAREYLYRWNLALISPLAFGAPGLLGA